MRRREYQKEFNGRERLALMPVIDLRGEKPQYIFVRKLISRDGMKFFEPKAYYVWIPGTETTGITQNPLYQDLKLLSRNYEKDICKNFVYSNECFDIALM